MLFFSGYVIDQVSEIFLSQMFQAATFAELPRQTADAHLAGS